MVQFMKGGGPYGEHLAAELLAPYLTIIPYGREGWVNRENPDPEDRLVALKALNHGAEALRSGSYDMVILDEVNGAIAFELLTVEELLEVMRSKPENIELVLTGRNADQRIIDIADLVTEMREIKHYYKVGVSARIGIEK
jgi:cob(I)alamin adenosyltransferase